MLKDCDYLFIWTRGGSGHRIVMEAKKQEYLQKGYTAFDLDLMGEWFFNSFRFFLFGPAGDFFVRLWDEAQEGGNIFTQRLLGRSIWLFEIIFSLIVYHRMKKLLLRAEKPIKTVIITQHLCNAALTRAIAHVNKKRGWNTKVEIWLSDLPSNQATHFFHSIKKISRSNKLHHLVTVYSHPLSLHKKEEHEKIWKRYCGRVKVITDEPLPIRQAFYQIEHCLKKESVLKLKIDGEEKDFHISLNDRVVTLLLGSQPPTVAVLQYVSQMIKTMKQMNKTPNENYPSCHFFIFCGSEKNELYSLVKEQIRRYSLPSNLQLIPFTFQSENIIARLFTRSDITLTRAGGSTAMELIHLSQMKKRVTLIHAEERRGIKKGPLSRGLAYWEAGNAKYLEEKLGAQIITPQQFSDAISPALFKEIS